MIRQAVRHLAQAWGMQIDEAADSTTAISALRSSVEHGCPYDLALLDLQLPDQQGAMLVPMIRSDPILAPIKLILMTTMHQREQVESLRSMQVSGYILKPVRASRLFDSLMSAFAEHVPSAIASGMTNTWETAVDSTQKARINRLLVDSRFKVLLVEDHPVNQAVILNQLQILGYEADYVSNGQEALDRLQEKSYDIVLMDCQMPVLDGYQTTQELRRREGSGRHTVVIALTAHALSDDRDKCLAAGMDDYLTKPIEQETLGATINQWVNLTKSKRASAHSEAQNRPQPSVLNMDEIPLDLERLNRISRGKVTFQQQLVQAFVKNAQPGLEQIRVAIPVGDCLTVEQQAHRIKGSSANVGVRLMPDVAAQLEQQAREKDLEGATEQLEVLERQLEKVNAFLKNWLV